MPDSPLSLEQAISKLSYALGYAESALRDDRGADLCLNNLEAVRTYLQQQRDRPEEGWVEEVGMK